MPNYEYHTFFAIPGYSSFILALTAHPSSPSSPHKTVHSPFILDSGTACHLSPNLSDFKTLRPIAAHSINGVGNSVSAHGIGTIKIDCGSDKLILHDAFYVSHALARLISIWLLLNPASKIRYHALFHPNHVLIADESNKVLAHGIANSDHHLYFLTDFSPHVPPSLSSPAPSAHYTSCPPDLDSWHKHLSHCGIQTIIDMARSLGPKVMPIDLSHSTSKCAACILGKQTHSSVPKIREGPKAKVQLERIYIDLCGPMSVASRSGRLFSINVIDDYSGFMWSLPLRSKGEASKILKHWIIAIEHQTPHRLKCLITDNGKLVSSEICDLCTDRRILHLFTAPYTSAQNGRTERLHRTIMDRTRATRISCNAPPNMWDEFCATAAYLHNLTGTAANNGKSPYELWHSRKPPLLHLHEIGCCVFSLINTNNPKILHRSIPCILIGYAPNAKAYWLWDPTTDRIFNSFHVSFIKVCHIPPPPPDSNEIQHSQLPNHPIPFIIDQHPTTVKPPPNVTNTSLQHPTTHYTV